MVSRVPQAARGAIVPMAAALLATGCSAASTAAPGTPAPANRGAHSVSTPTASPASLPAAGTATTVASSLGTVASGQNWGIAADGESVWLYDGDTGVVKRVTAATGAVAATIQLHPGCAGNGCGNLALGGGAVWVANDVDGTITRIDATTNAVTATIHLAANAAPQVFTTPGAVWSANYFADSYTRIDPRTGSVTATLAHHLSAEAVTDAGGSVWLCDASGTPALTRLDPTTGAVQKGVDVISGGSKVFCAGMAQLGSSLYVITDNDANPQVVDPATGAGTETQLPVDGQGVRGVVGGAGGTWLLDAKLGVFKLDPASGRAAAQVSLAGGAGIAGDGHDVWVISDSGTLYRIVPAA